MAVISKEELKILYCKEKLTDKEIAQLKNTDRTNIVHLRKKYQIATRQTTGGDGITLVEKKLKQLSYRVGNMKKQNKINEYDLYVNDEMKIEVMAAKKDEKTNSFKFILTAKDEHGIRESELRVKLNNGRTRKIYRKIVDFIVCVGIEETETHYWVIPSNEIPDTLQTLSLTPFSVKSKYQKYFHNWEFLNKKEEK